VVAPEVPAEPALVAPGASPLGLPPSTPPVLPAELLGPDGPVVYGVFAPGLAFVAFEPLGLALLLELLPLVAGPLKLLLPFGPTVVEPPFDVALGVVLPLLIVAPDVAPLLSAGPVVEPEPLLIEELLSVELEEPPLLLREDPVESPELLAPAAPPETLDPALPAEPAPPAPPPAEPPAAPPPPAPPPPAAALTPDTGRATRATPASK
jgi:hypothetical protein